MNESVMKFASGLRSLLVIVVLAAAAYFFLSNSPSPFGTTRGRPSSRGIFSESSLVDKVARLQTASRAFSGRAEARKLIDDSVTAVQYFTTPKPTVVVRIRCGLYRGNESVWKVVLDHWARYYCFNNNQPSVEGLIINCQDKALLSDIFTFE